MTEYETRVNKCHIELGIAAEYQKLCDLPIQKEATNLVHIGQDIFDRPQQLEKQAATAWFNLRDAAKKDDVTLNVVSAYRSLEKQVLIFRRKLDNGSDIYDILKVNVAPGFSEHHTGRALDLTTPDSQPLSESFEDTAAFNWLIDHAGACDFTLSYPRNNGKVAYEPWHWAFQVK